MTVQTYFTIAPYLYIEESDPLTSLVIDSLSLNNCEHVRVWWLFFFFNF